MYYLAGRCVVNFKSQSKKRLLIKRRWRQAVTYLDVQSRRGLVCCRVADEHHFQAVGELQPSVNPFVLRRANDVVHHHLYGRVGHFEGQG